MENQDIRTLRLLEAVGEEKSPSQRELARKLDISLGLVNAFVKRLARKGYFKITNLPANRIRYILTPKGMAEKTRLTYEYIQYSFGYYRQARARISEIFARLGKGRQRIVFWGVGELAEIAYVSLVETNLELLAIVDPEKAGQAFLGRKVIHPEDLADLEYDIILMTTINDAGQAEVPSELSGRQVVFPAQGLK